MVTDSLLVSVPAMGHEEHIWTVTLPASRAERQRQSGPYRSGVPAVLADWQPTFPGAVSAALSDAEKALADFDAHAALRLGNDSHVLAPMSAILLRTESASSSQIEQLTASAKQLALVEIDEGDRPNARTVVGNVRAMEAALRLSDTLDEDSVLAMHFELLSRQPGWESEAGRWRDSLVWVSDTKVGPRTARHVAPQFTLVPEAMADLFAFMAREDIPALAHVAVAHAQFETIHPFSDGNGRTGRALAQAMMRNKGIVRNATVPLSAGILRDTDAYLDALGAFRAGNAHPILTTFAAAALFAAGSGRGLVDELADEVDRAREAVSGIRRHALVWRLIPELVGQPIINSRFVEQRLRADKMTAGRAITQLVEAGVLTEASGRRRSRVYEHRGVLGVLDEYAASIRRR